MRSCSSSDNQDDRWMGNLRSHKAGVVVLAALACLVIIFETSRSLKSSFVPQESLKNAASPARNPLGVDAADRMHLLVDKMRLEIAKESFRMMLTDTRESVLADITPMITLLKTALTTFGIRKVHEEILLMEPFAATLKVAAAALGINGFRTQILRPGLEEENFEKLVLEIGNSHPTIKYYGIPNARPEYEKRGLVCHGHLWWLWHYAGNAAADLLLHGEKRILLDYSENTFVTTPLEYLEEFRRLQRSEYPDISYFHVQHGFVTHYLEEKRPGLESYPVDILNEFCQELVWNDEYIEDAKNDMGRECRHSFGHAIFYNLAIQENPGLNISLTNALRPASNFDLSEETICKKEKICLGAPNKRTFQECQGGFAHSWHLYFLNNSTKKDFDKSNKQPKEKSCRGREDYKALKKELWKGMDSLPY